MRTYGKVKIVFWEDEKIAPLSDSAKLLALYCLTGEHSNAIGCYRLPIGYIQTDLRWDAEKSQAALNELIASGFIIYDESTQFILIPNYLEHNPIENSRVGKMCVGLVNPVMRSGKIFPHLIKVLRPHKHRFILKDKNIWEPKWDTLSGVTVQSLYTVSDTISDSLSDTVYDTLYDTVSTENSSDFNNHDQSTVNTEENTLSDTVCDSVSDTVFSTMQDFAPPEPQPEPQPQPKIKNDNDDTGTKFHPVDIIKIFDEAIVQVFGKEMARPWPNGNDMDMAKEFVAAGADLELCRQLFLKHQHSHKQKGKFAISSLAYFRNAVVSAVNERKYYQNNPVQEVAHEQGRYKPGNASRSKSGHDAFTEALVEVVSERQ